MPSQMGILGRGHRNYIEIERPYEKIVDRFFEERVIMQEECPAEDRPRSRTYEVPDRELGGQKIDCKSVWIGLFFSAVQV